MDFKEKIFAFIISIWVIGIIIFTYINLGDGKFLAMTSVIFMGSGVFYSLYTYNKNVINKSEMKFDIKRIEKENRFAKPFRFLGMIFLIIQFLIWSNAFKFKYDDFILYGGLLFFLLYIIIIYSESKKYSKQL